MISNPTRAISKPILCANDTSRVEDRVPDCIRRRAYELFEARGRQAGHELDDWLQAEREIKHHFGIQ